MTWWKRLMMRLGKCPYCGLHYLPPKDLKPHLGWRHASKSEEWAR